ncbi:MAG TPA: iron uptake system protein EfeO [Sporichthya sp.]|nr:iron uptake system protein EfeO [Sporichthya sp.]
MRLPRTPLRTVSLTAAAGLTVLLAGCSDDNGPSALTAEEVAAGGSQIAVAATDTSCGIDQSSIAAGPVVVKINNAGKQVTEVYILKDHGTGIVTEREGIQPGDEVELTAELPEGEFQISCRPSAGERVNTDFTVTSGSAPALSAEDQKAVDAYRRYVADQVDDSVAKTKLLVAAIKAQDVDKAKDLYAPSRLGWESIEPVAEAFGDIDPKVDLREADVEDGDTWTGWHVIEKALWKGKSTAGMDKVGDQLLTDLQDLVQRIPDAEITPTSMANGAKELLDEVASGKITGEEEAFSHTDLVDFQGNLDGARKVFELLEPIAQKNDPELVRTLHTEFDDCEAALAKYAKGNSYVSYDTVTDSQRRALSDAVNALGEPLSKLAAAVV